VTGSYASGLAVYAIVCVWGLTLLLAVRGGWSLTWARRGVVDGMART